MYVQQIYTSCLAQASYYIESRGEAVIIDPIRDSKMYMDLLRERKATLKYVFETHFHADFVSGHVELARLTDSKIVFGPNSNTIYDSITAHHNQEFNFGELTIKAIHTPGHTLESVCYLLLSKDNNEEAVFTGDTLFIGEVGRPDLAVNPNLKSEDLAGMLYDSLHNILMKLPNHVIVYPGHGAGSACGKNISKERHSTIGEQKKNNYALQKMSKNEFINIVLSGITKAPDYFVHDVKMNQQGYDSVANILTKSLYKLTAHNIEKNIKKGVVILDVRMPNDFEKGFIPTSINIGKTGMFAPWVGTIINPNVEIMIVCYPNEEVEVVSRLARIGYENIIGYTYGVDEWNSENKALEQIDSIYASPDIFTQENNFLDVRKLSEFSLGAVKNSLHIPLSKLSDNIDQISKDKSYLIYCAGGYRSMIAASILKAKGYTRVKNIYGGFASISQNIK